MALYRILFLMLSIAQTVGMVTTLTQPSALTRTWVDNLDRATSKPVSRTAVQGSAMPNAVRDVLEEKTSSTRTQLTITEMLDGHAHQVRQHVDKHTSFFGNAPTFLPSALVHGSLY